MCASADASASKCICFKDGTGYCLSPQPQALNLRPKLLLPVVPKT